MTATKKRVRKSAPLNKEERKAFKKWVKNQPTKIDASEALNVTRITLDRILELGRCSGLNIDKIKSLINGKQPTI